MKHEMLVIVDSAEHADVEDIQTVLAFQLKNLRVQTVVRPSEESELRARLAMAEALLKEETDKCLCIFTPIQGAAGANMRQEELCKPDHDACWWCRVRAFLGHRPTSTLQTLEMRVRQSFRNGLDKAWGVVRRWHPLLGDGDLWSKAEDEIRLLIEESRKSVNPPSVEENRR